MGKNVTPKLSGKPGQHPAVSSFFLIQNVLACNFFWAFPTFRHSQMKDLSKIQTAHLISLEFHDHSVNGRVGTLFYRLEKQFCIFFNMAKTSISSLKNTLVYSLQWPISHAPSLAKKQPIDVLPGLKNPFPTWTVSGPFGSTTVTWPMFGGKLVNCGGHRDYIPTHSASFGIVPLTSTYIIHLGIHNDFYIPKKNIIFLPDVSGFISPYYFNRIRRGTLVKWSRPICSMARFTNSIKAPAEVHGQPLSSPSWFCRWTVGLMTDISCVV